MGLMYCRLNTSWSTLKDQCRCVMPVCASLVSGDKGDTVMRHTSSHEGVAMWKGERCWSVLSNSPDSFEINSIRYMNNQFENALRCTVAAYAGVQLTDSDMKKLDLAAKIALANTICNIYVHGLIFTARWAICEDRVQFSFHKEGVHNRLTTMYYENETLYVEDIKGPYDL